MGRKPNPHVTGRAIFRIEISPEAAEEIGSVSTRTGMTQIAITSRLIKWLADQPDAVRAGILTPGFSFAGEPSEILFLKSLIGRK